MTRETMADLPVPCQHIADYYQRLWESHKCIAYNLLRYGYREWAAGVVKLPGNNLFEQDNG